jgi:hypothetical protein
MHYKPERKTVKFEPDPVWFVAGVPVESEEAAKDLARALNDARRSRREDAGDPSDQLLPDYA